MCVCACAPLPISVCICVCVHAHACVHVVSVSVQFQVLLNKVSQSSERPIRASPSLLAVSPRLPSKQHQCWSDCAKIVPDRVGSSDGSIAQTLRRRDRNHDRCPTTPRCNTEQYKQSFFPRTTIGWNKLNSCTVQARGALPSPSNASECKEVT